MHVVTATKESLKLILFMKQFSFSAQSDIFEFIELENYLLIQIAKSFFFSLHIKCFNCH